MADLTHVFLETIEYKKGNKSKDDLKRNNMQNRK